jgi:hypothetical protein
MITFVSELSLLNISVIYYEDNTHFAVAVAEKLL